jgi:hypothetical protein
MLVSSVVRGRKKIEDDGSEREYLYPWQPASERGRSPLERVCCTIDSLGLITSSMWDFGKVRVNRFLFREGEKGHHVNEGEETFMSSYFSRSLGYLPLAFSLDHLHICENTVSVRAERDGSSTSVEVEAESSLIHPFITVHFLAQ